MSDVQLTVVEGDVAQVIGAIPGPQGPAGAVAAAIDGSAALPSIAFASDTDTGLYRVGANQLGVSTGGTQRLVIDETGQIEATSLGTAAAPTWTFVGDPDTGIYSPGANQLALATNGSGRIIIDGFGSVRFPDGGLYGKSDNTGVIGVYGGGAFNQGAGGVFYSSSHPTTPNLISFVNGAFVERLRITSTGQLSHIGAGSSGSPAVSFNGSAASNSLVIDSNSRVGIGTASPVFNLVVAGNATDGTWFNTSGAQARVGLGAISSGTAGAFQILFDRASGVTTFGVGTRDTPSTAFAIDASNRFGIGTVSPAQLLHVQGVARLQTSATGTVGLEIYNGTRNTGISSDFANSTTYIDHNQLLVFRDSQNSYVTRFAVRADGMFEVKGAGTVGVSPAFSVSGSAPANSALIDSSGRLLLGTLTNTGGSLFQVNDNRIRIATAKTPASATDTGSAGEICWDANYIYVCTATNTWKRTAIATW